MQYDDSLTYQALLAGLLWAALTLIVLRWYMKGGDDDGDTPAC